MTPQEKSLEFLFLLQEFLVAERYYNDPENGGWGHLRYTEAKEELEKFLTEHLFKEPEA